MSDVEIGDDNPTNLGGWVGEPMPEKKWSAAQWRASIANALGREDDDEPDLPEATKIISAQLQTEVGLKFQVKKVKSEYAALQKKFEEIAYALDESKYDGESKDAEIERLTEVYEQQTGMKPPPNMFKPMPFWLHRLYQQGKNTARIAVPTTLPGLPLERIARTFIAQGWRPVEKPVADDQEIPKWQT